MLVKFAGCAHCGEQGSSLLPSAYAEEVPGPCFFSGMFRGFPDTAILLN